LVELRGKLVEKRRRVVVFREVGRKNAEAGRNEPLLWNYSRGELVEIPKKLVESPPSILRFKQKAERRSGFLLRRSPAGWKLVELRGKLVEKRRRVVVFGEVGRKTRRLEEMSRCIGTIPGGNW
jgi:hypothetical protein